MFIPNPDNWFYCGVCHVVAYRFTECCGNVSCSGAGWSLKRSGRRDEPISSVTMRRFDGRISRATCPPYMSGVGRGLNSCEGVIYLGQISGE